MKLVSKGRSRDGIAMASSLTETDHGAINTDVTVGYRKSITMPESQDFKYKFGLWHLFLR